MPNIQNLDTHEKDTVLQQLLFTMNMEQRGAFIDTLPVHYARLFEMELKHVVEIIDRHNEEEIEPA